MAYTPINWQTGQTITAEKLNKMDNGWSVDNTQLFSETVTTTAGDIGNSAVLSYTEGTFPDSMDITFDSTEYTCPRQSGYGQYWYGAPNPGDWSTYPFVLLFMSEQWTLVTQTAGTYTISATALTAEASSNFVLASKTATTNLIQSVSPFFFTLYSTTWQEVYDAMSANRLCVRSVNDGENIDFYIAITASSTDYSVRVISPLQSGVYIRYQASSADDPLSD